MFFMLSSAQIWPWVNSYNAHFSHVTLDRFPINLYSFSLHVSRNTT